MIYFDNGALLSKLKQNLAILSNIFLYIPLFPTAYEI